MAATNVKVELGGKIKNSHQLIRAFIRKCKNEAIVQEYKQSLVFETKGQKRRRKKREGKKRAKARQSKKQS